jgi:hypothetical protein
MRAIRFAAVAAALVLALGGCATTGRVAYTPQEDAKAVVAGIPEARLAEAARDKATAAWEQISKSTDRDGADLSFLERLSIG